MEFGVLASVLGSNASVARMMFCERCSENCGACGDDGSPVLMTIHKKW